MKTVNFNKEWRFIKDDQTTYSNRHVDDSSWRLLDLPHDYAIEGPFSAENDLQYQKVVADGIMDAIEHVGRTGGLPITDSAWYRKQFTVSESATNVFLEFDGVMNNSSVYVNGQLIGERHYGYTSFSYDVTDAIEKGKENTLAVRVAPEQCASRWYPGAGIYRHVRLIEKNATYIPYCGTYITSQIKEDVAEINCEVKLCGEMDGVELLADLVDPSGNKIASNRLTSATELNNLRFSVDNPKLWDTVEANLYKVIFTVISGQENLDMTETTIGLRSIMFHSEKGFFLNNVYTKFKGVCMHHDLGALGTAVNKSAMRRQLTKLKAMGCNAIRTSHNPPAPEYLDLCDEMGFLVIDESFDEWRYPKVDNGYSNYFDQWAERDLVDLVRRDRNHPCIVMWSIGNEILDQFHKEGADTTRWLSDLCHREDPTRPTTAGFNSPEAAIKNGLCDEVDIVGLNYRPHKYELFHKEHPDWILYGSETESCVSSRGLYDLDPVESYPARNREDYHIPSYDLEGPPWACSPDTEFEAQDNCTFILGEFVWTGFDYIGEPTPYRLEWPSRSSYFGILDLAGMEKDRYYSYQSKWTDKEVLHLMPHWNWQEGDQVSVHCYSSFDKVELFLNGQSLGIREKNDKDAFTKHRLVWDNVAFTEGVIKAVAVDKPTVTCEVKTTDEAYELRLSPEKTSVYECGEDLTYIKCDVVDSNGIICPHADNQVSIEVTGAGVYVAADSGDQTSLRMFHEPYCKAFNGSFMIIVKGKVDDANQIKVQVSSDGLKTGSCQIDILK